MSKFSLEPKAMDQVQEKLPWWETLALFCLFLWVVPFGWHSSSVGDEWLLLGNARRIIFGDYPYLDYFQFIPPLAESILVLPRLILPDHPLTAAHVLNAALVLGGAGALWQLGRQLGLSSTYRLMAPWYLVGAWLPHWPVWSHHTLALVLMLSALLALPSSPTPRFGAFWLSGLASGLCAMAVQQEGAAVVGAVALWIGLHVSGGQAGKCLVAYGLGVGLPWGVLLLVLQGLGALGAFVDQVVLWPWLHYRQAGGFNEVSLWQDLSAFAQGWPAVGAWGRAGHAWGLLAVPALALALGVVCYAWHLPYWRRKNQVWGAEAKWQQVFWAAALTCGAACLGRTDLTHLAYASVLPTLLGLGALSQVRGFQRGPGWPLVVGGVLVFGVASSGALWHLAVVRAKPGLWLSWESPDDRLRRHPAWRWAHGHISPQDGVMAAPYGGFVYTWWGRPRAMHSILLPPSMKYLGPEDWALAWKQVEVDAPRWLVLETCGDPQAYAVVVPRAYQKVEEMPSPLYGAACPWQVYRRVGASR